MAIMKAPRNSLAEINTFVHSYMPHDNAIFLSKSYIGSLHKNNCNISFLTSKLYFLVSQKAQVLQCGYSTGGQNRVVCRLPMELRCTKVFCLFLKQKLGTRQHSDGHTVLQLTVIRISQVSYLLHLWAGSKLLPDWLQQLEGNQRGERVVGE